MADYRFEYTDPGEYDLDIPDGAENIWIEAYGAGGSNAGSSGGNGGYAAGNLPEAAGETLRVVVGGGSSGTNGGFNGGGDAATSAGGGGGGSDVRLYGTLLNERVLVAGGGAGSGDQDAGGDGGGLEGGDGSGTRGGGGGTQTSGGSGGDGFGGADGEDGSFGEGGDGSDGDRQAGAGGGGWYGGGGGGNSSGSGSGGGGGSSYVDDVNNAVTNTGQGASSENDGEVIVEFDYPFEAADNLDVVNEHDTELDLEWDSADGEADGIRVYRDTSSGVDPSTATEVADLPASAINYTDSGLDNGTSYYYVLETYRDEDGFEQEALSNEAGGQTTLPNLEGFTLDSTEDSELVAAWDDVLNAGQYRIQWRRSIDSTFADEATVNYDVEPLGYQISSILAGEEYDVRVRTESDEIDGTWHTASEITVLVAADNIAFQGVTRTGFDATWSLNSEFDGSQQIWIARTDYEHTDPKGELVATVSDTAEFAQVGDLHPEREYLVTIRAITQYVSASNDATTSTESAGLEQSPVPSRGWYAEVEYPRSDSNTETVTKTPSILDDIERRPTLNGRPELMMPVPRDESWTASHLESETVDVRAWKDGTRLPADTLDDVGTETARSTLYLTGGRQLEQRVQVDVDTRERHELARELIEAHTDYVANVDDPETEATDSIVLAAALASEFGMILEGLGPEAAAGIDGDATASRQSNVLIDVGGVIDGGSGTPWQSSTQDPDAAGGGYRTFTDLGDSLEFDLPALEYTIPENEFRPVIRLGCESNPAELELSLLDETDTVIGSMPLWDQTGSSDFPVWFSNAGNPTGVLSGGVGEWTGGDIPPGEYTARIECISSGGDVDVDLLSLRDARFSYEWPSNVDAEGGIAGPELFPDQAVVQFDTYQSVLSIRAGSAEIAIDDTSGDQYVALENGVGERFVADNAATVSGTFAEPTAEITLELGLGRHGDDGEGAVPRYGVEPQTVSEISVEADLDDTPLAIDWTRDALLETVLDDLAGEDFVWEVGADGDALSIEWCQPGQRESDSDLDVVDYEARTVRPQTQRVTVKGAARRIRDESFVADVGEPVALEAAESDGEIVAGTYRVVDGSGTRYEAGSDYSIDHFEGTITALEAGDIVDQEEYLIDYEHKVAGTFESGEFSGDAREDEVFELSELTTERACGLAAKWIVDRSSSRRTEIDVQFPPTVPADISLVDGLYFGPRTEEVGGFGESFGLSFGTVGERVLSEGEIPHTSPLAIYSLEETPDGLRGRFGESDPVQDTINGFRDRLQTLSRRS